MLETADRSALTGEQRDFYREQGCLVLRDLLPAELMAEASAEADALLQRHDLIAVENLRCRWQTNVHTGACEFETFDPIIDLGPVCRRLALDERLLAALAALYGEEACLFKDKLIFKPPGLKGYGLHQDWIAWPGFPRSFLTVLVPLDRADADNGCTEVFPGYHKNGTLSPEDGDYHELSPDLIDESRGVNLELDPGDVAIFGGFTPHRSAPNRSDRWRRQLYLSYNKLSDGGQQREKHYEEFHRWLRVKYAEYGKTSLYFR
ncbi:MAG TPA: phytanoyl-CoA dioxygenase family protein [Gemmataceae bacterium]|jgi:ectoine hydroxylase-related dioxygenase (phytanoyl-CoA dioxygenase family)